MSKIILWVDPEELRFAIDHQDEIRTITIPVHSFPIHSSDIPIEVTATTKEALGKDLNEEYPNWDRFL